MGVIGVEGRATMTVQFTKQDRSELGRPGGEIFPILDMPAVLLAAFDPTTSDGGTDATGMYVHSTPNSKLVKTGQNWYYSLHA
jgi:hypothetical protein